MIEAIAVPDHSEWLEKRQVANLTCDSLTKMSRRNASSTKVLSPPPSMTDVPWYHFEMPRHKCEALLIEAEEGTYLLRDSSSIPGQLTLSVRASAKHVQRGRSPVVCHFHIQHQWNGKEFTFKFGDHRKAKKYATLGDLIRHSKPTPSIRSPSGDTDAIELKYPLLRTTTSIEHDSQNDYDYPTLPIIGSQPNCAYNAFGQQHPPEQDSTYSYAEAMGFLPDRHPYDPVHTVYREPNKVASGMSGEDNTAQNRDVMQYEASGTYKEIETPSQYGKLQKYEAVGRHQAVFQYESPQHCEATGHYERVAQYESPQCYERVQQYERIGAIHGACEPPCYHRTKETKPG